METKLGVVAVMREREAEATAEEARARGCGGRVGANGVLRQSLVHTCRNLAPWFKSCMGCALRRGTDVVPPRPNSYPAADDALGRAKETCRVVS